MFNQRVGQLEDPRGITCFAGIDLLNLSGKVLCQISSDIDPLYMVASQNHLVVTTDDWSIAKTSLQNRSMVFNQRIKELDNTSILGVSSVHRTVHLSLWILKPEPYTWLPITACGRSSCGPIQVVETLVIH